MIQVAKYLTKQQNNPKIMKLTNYEEQSVTRQFQEVGIDIRFTMESLSDGQSIQKSYYLDNEGKSIDTGYFKAMLKYTYSLYGEGGFIDFNALKGKLFIVGIDETFSSKTLQTYQNISIFLPLESEFVEQIKSI